VASHLDPTSAFAAAATCASPEMLVPSPAYVDALRARAARYTQLAESLWDPRVIAVVQACARDLEAEAILIADGGRLVRHPRRINGPC